MLKNTSGNVSLLLVFILPLALALPLLASGVGELLQQRSKLSVEIDLLLAEAASYLPDRQLARNHLLTKLNSLEKSALYESHYLLELSSSRIYFSLETPISLKAGAQLTSKQSRLAVRTARELTPLETVLFLPKSFSKNLVDSWQRAGAYTREGIDPGCEAKLILFLKQFALAVSALRSQAVNDALSIFRYDSTSLDAVYSERSGSPVLVSANQSSCPAQTLTALDVLPVRAPFKESASCVESLEKGAGSLQREKFLEGGCGVPTDSWETLRSLLALSSFDVSSSEESEASQLQVMRRLSLLGFRGDEARLSPYWRREVIWLTELELSGAKLRKLDIWAQQNLTTVHILQIKPLRLLESSTSRSLGEIQYSYSKIVKRYEIKNQNDLASVSDHLLSFRLTELLF